MPTAHDFMNYTSFPSSLKLVNDAKGPDYVWATIASDIPVLGGSKITAEVKLKRNVSAIPTSPYAGIRIDTKRPIPTSPDHIPYSFLLDAGPGSYDWTKVQNEKTIPADANLLLVRIYAKGYKGDTLWLDDLKIYQDDLLIYSNNFSNWWPDIIGVPVAVVGAVAAFFGLKRRKR